MLPLEGELERGSEESLLKVQRPCLVVNLLNKSLLQSL